MESRGQPPEAQSNGPFLGLARLEEADLRALPEGVTHLEVESEAYFRQTPRARVRFFQLAGKRNLRLIPRMSLRLLAPESASEQLAEICTEFGARLEFVLFATGRKHFDPDLWMRFRSVRRELFQRQTKVFYEWSREDTALTTRALSLTGEPVGWVIDPDHHWRFVKLMNREPSLHFKLHGWHPDRWMRRYGGVLGRRLLSRVAKIESSILILAHSGRVAEAPDFALWRSE